MLSAGLAVLSLFLSCMTADAHHVIGLNVPTFLILLPPWMALGWLAVLYAMGASRRAYLALAATNYILTTWTIIAYVPDLANGPKGWFPGLALIGFALSSYFISICFPLVFTACWLLYGRSRDHRFDR